MAKGERSEGNPRRKVHREAFSGSLDVGTGNLRDASGQPVAGPAAARAAQEQKLAAADQEWGAWHANYEKTEAPSDYASQRKYAEVEEAERTGKRYW